MPARICSSLYNTHSCSLPLYASRNLCSSFYLTLTHTVGKQAFEGHTRSNRSYISSFKYGNTDCVPVRECDFMAALPHCQLLGDYNIGDNWTIADRCLTHTHIHTHVNRDGHEELSSVLSGLTLTEDNIKEAGVSLRLHVS